MLSTRDQAHPNPRIRPCPGSPSCLKTSPPTLPDPAHPPSSLVSCHRQNQISSTCRLSPCAPLWRSLLSLLLPMRLIPLRAMVCRPPAPGPALATLAPSSWVALVSWQRSDGSSTDDIKTTAASLAYDTMSYYKGNTSGQTPGILPGPPPAGDYYWWEAGALWGAMIDYWHFTGDSTYNDVVTDAMLFQVGPNRDYMPPNVTASLGNDDQASTALSFLVPHQTQVLTSYSGLLGHVRHDGCGKQFP